MKPVVYRIDFPSGDFYIGATCNFAARKHSHLASLRNPEKAINSKVRHAIRSTKHMEVRVIAEHTDRESLHLLERKLISELNPTLNVVLEPTPLPQSVVPNAKPFGDSASIAEYARSAGKTYRQAKYAKFKEDFIGPIQKIEYKSNATKHPPDPRKQSRLIFNNGWYDRSQVRTVSKNTYERRLQRGWSEWDALTIPATPNLKIENLSVPYHVYYNRRKKGYSEDVCKGNAPLPRKERNVKRRIITIGDESKTVDQWAKELGVKSATIHARLRLGWTEAQAVGKDKTNYDIKKEAAKEKIANRKARPKYKSPDGFIGTVSDHARRLDMTWYNASKAVSKYEVVS